MRADIVDVDNVEDALAAYRARSDVASAEVDSRVHMLTAPADNEYAKQWNLQPVSPANPASLDWEPVYPANKGAGVLVAVVDTGFHHGGTDEPLHVEDALAYNFVDNSTDATDDNGHGTHVSGTIAQRTDNRPNPTDVPSIAGVASEARIMPVKVLDGQGGGTTANTIAGLLWAANKGATVINLSLGGTYSKAMCDAVAVASKTSLVIAATGNEANGGLTPVDYPAACPGAIAVGGLRADGSRGPYSNGGCENGLVAPGGDLDPRTEIAPYGDPRNGILQEQWVPPPSSTTAGRFGFFFDSGTSMSAAHVAGAAAVLLAINPDVRTVARVLRTTARDLGPAGPDDAYGMGAVDLAAAVRALANPAASAAQPAEKVGYWTVASDGGIFAFGDAPFLGSNGGRTLNSPIVGMARTATGNGYWLVAADGGIFAFGDARFLGSTGDLRINKPIVAMASTETGNGYWLVASDGGIFAFGDAKYFGSTGNVVLNRPIVAMVADRFGNGYWLVANDGGIFAFGIVGFFGSTGATQLNKPIVAMARTPTGAGYWLVASDGGIFAFGDAGFFGSTGGTELNSPIVSIAATCFGTGYWLVAADGGVFAFGGAPFVGSAGDIKLSRPIVAFVLAVDHRNNLG